MKKNILTFFICTAVLATPYCKKKAASAGELPDSYDEEITVIKVEDEKIKQGTSESSDPYNEKKLKPQNERSFGQKMLGLDKFQEIEPFSLYVKSMVGKMHLRKASLIHRAATDIGGYYCHYDTSAYAVQFAEQARSVIVSGVKQYIEDFDNKKLDKKAKLKKTESVYGIVEGYEEYGLAKSMLSNRARPKVCIGYTFVDGKPYFTLYVKQADNLAYVKRSDDAGTMSKAIQQRYYFTKAQAKKLATFLSNDNISFLQDSTSYVEIQEGDFDDY